MFMHLFLSIFVFLAKKLRHGSGANGVQYEETPTWAVALVSAVFVIISVLIEHGIHSLEKWFRKRQKKAMIEA
ncbi:hypothetical protein LOK49_LG07G01001 [Camellia lanceoleosa]|uniref:Uncharacterized protein n=1 Tax=Camellia lanceoleosa TaxID=1840588 RepID=A0ACC0H746_9ERIC|nr:hypothetical protein LOK49_LG07G01001 [Camellia lanceoleosa]